MSLVWAVSALTENFNGCVPPLQFAESLCDSTHRLVRRFLNKSLRAGGNDDRARPRRGRRAAVCLAPGLLVLARCAAACVRLSPDWPLLSRRIHAAGIRGDVGARQVRMAG